MTHGARRLRWLQTHPWYECADVDDWTAALDRWYVATDSAALQGKAALADWCAAVKDWKPELAAPDGMV